MSTPPSLRLPEGVRVVQLSTGRGVTPALEVRSKGPGQALLLPGFTGSKEDFLDILPLLADSGFSCAAIDLRGQLGSFASDDPSDYDLEALADDVLAVAAALSAWGARPHVVGHSFGGLVARAAALRDPEAVRSLTLMGSGPAALPEPGHRGHLLRQLLEALPREDLAAIYARKRELETAAGSPLHEPDIEAFLRDRFLAHCPTALRRMAEVLLTEPDRTAALAVVGDRLPLHVMYGRDDDAWPPSEQADMARRLGARETVVPGAAHSPAAEQPTLTAAVLVEFWRSVEGD